MIEINLLPGEFKKRKKAYRLPDVTLAFMPILMGIIAFLILAHIALKLTINLNKVLYERMSRDYEEVESQKRSIKEINTENLNTKKNVTAIDALMEKKILWSLKLNQLSELIVAGVWFTRLSIDEKTIVTKLKTPEGEMLIKDIKKPITEKTVIHYLNIQGEASSLYGDELAIIGKFIEELKEDEGFFKDFSNIELGSTELHAIGDIEVMKFNIICYLKKAYKE